ncbi:hypothetical protein RAS1_07780 [Phycisphaerae bacterium RAS1]|nr:hypothetical protein RAS1_07780 [Phycisphaerae bacterium RAS1]
MKAVQQQFQWLDAGDATKKPPPAAENAELDASLPERQPTGQPTSAHDEINLIQAERADRPDGLPIPAPLPQAVDAGVFGQTVNGPVEPDVDEVAALTEQHADEMIVLLADCNAIEDSIRDGCDPRTGRVPKTPEARTRLAESLQAEAHRLSTAYADAVAAYAGAFGDEAAQALDVWVRKATADACAVSPSYDATHPWHYFHAGDNAIPVPVGEIPADDQAGQFVERDLPKHPAKRLARLRELFARESQLLEADRARYMEIVERGAEALSRYDREIAHTSDAMARATTLALKYRHVSLGLGRVQWIRAELRRLGAVDLFEPSNSMDDST